MLRLIHDVSLVNRTRFLANACCVSVGRPSSRNLFSGKLANGNDSLFGPSFVKKIINNKNVHCFLSTATELSSFGNNISNNNSNNVGGKGGNNDSSAGKGGGLLSLLSPKEKELLMEQKELMQQARELTTKVGSVPIKDYTNTFLDNLVDETTFSIVVAGEFNAGKSTLINALLGKKILAAGALPTTDSITILTQQQEAMENNYVEESHSSEINSNETQQKDFSIVQKQNVSPTHGGGVIIHHISNVPLLEDLTLIDTPGTNAVLADHTARTLRLLPTADLILFVTSADRPFPESERALLSSIQSYRKSIVVIVNKMDILENSGGSYGMEEKQRVVDFVTDHASDLLGGRPIVIPVSSRDALSAKLMGQDNTNYRKSKDNSNTNSSSSKNNDNMQHLPNKSVWERSNFATLESFLKDSLTMETRIKTKLVNPIGQAEGMVTASLGSLRKEQEELEQDIATIKLLHSQYTAWQKEMDAQTMEFRQDITSLLQKEGNRCDILLNRVGIFQFYKSALFNTKYLEKEYDNTKPNFSSRQSLVGELLEHVQETADSIATRGRAQGQAVIEFLGKRPAVKNQSLVGSVSAASRFEDTRKLLADKLTDAVKTHVSVDEEKEKQNLLRSLQQTAIMSAGLQAGALVSGLATAALVLDSMMGMGTCSLFAISGGMIFSQGRQNTQQRHRDAWIQREERLNEALQEICSKELSRVERRILDGVAPYTRFVETEKERLDGLMDMSEDVLAQAHALRNRINKL